MNTEAMASKPHLTIATLKREAKSFLAAFSKEHPELFGITDGKAVGTYVEEKFNAYLRERYEYQSGNAAVGIDFPALQVDVKATSIRKPQSSCAFKSADQKVYGLGYNLLVFVYEKTDDAPRKTAVVDFKNVVFVRADKTADFQTTRGLLDILEREGNTDDIVAFLEERNLFLDEIGRMHLAEKIMHERPCVGYLTISNALQWRLAYDRVIKLASGGGDRRRGEHPCVSSAIFRRRSSSSVVCCGLSTEAEAGGPEPSNPLAVWATLLLDCAHLPHPHLRYKGSSCSRSTRFGQEWRPKAREERPRYKSSKLISSGSIWRS